MIIHAHSTLHTRLLRAVIVNKTGHIHIKIIKLRMRGHDALWVPSRYLHIDGRPWMRPMIFVRCSLLPTPNSFSSVSSPQSMSSSPEIWLRAKALLYTERLRESSACWTWGDFASKYYPRTCIYICIVNRKLKTSAHCLQIFQCYEDWRGSLW